MTIDQIRTLCLSLPGVYEDIKWGDHLCFNVGGKMFLVTAPDNSPVSASFKASDEDFNTLPEREGFIPAPYMARLKWIYVDSISRFSPKEWAQHLRIAYDLVVEKLPARTRASLGASPVKPAGKPKAKVKSRQAKKKKGNTKPKKVKRTRR